MKFNKRVLFALTLAAAGSTYAMQQEDIDALRALQKSDQPFQIKCLGNEIFSLPSHGIPVSLRLNELNTLRPDIKEYTIQAPRELVQKAFALGMLANRADISPEGFEQIANILIKDKSLEDTIELYKLCNFFKIQRSLPVLNTCLQNRYKQNPTQFLQKLAETKKIPSKLQETINAWKQQTPRIHKRAKCSGGCLEAAGDLPADKLLVTQCCNQFMCADDLEALKANALRDYENYHNPAWRAEHAASDDFGGWPSQEKQEQKEPECSLCRAKQLKTKQAILDAADADKCVTITKKWNLLKSDFMQSRTVKHLLEENNGEFILPPYISSAEFDVFVPALECSEDYTADLRGYLLGQLQDHGIESVTTIAKLANYFDVPKIFDTSIAVLAKHLNLPAQLEKCLATGTFNLKLPRDVQNLLAQKMLDADRELQLVLNAYKKQITPECMVIFKKLNEIQKSNPDVFTLTNALKLGHAEKSQAVLDAMHFKNYPELQKTIQDLPAEVKELVNQMRQEIEDQKSWTDVKKKVAVPALSAGAIYAGFSTFLLYMYAKSNPDQIHHMLNPVHQVGITKFILNHSVLSKYWWGLILGDFAEYLKKFK